MPFASVLVDRLVEERLPNHADAFSRADLARGSTGPSSGDPEPAINVGSLV
jgi:hypothetical protein